MSVPLRVLAVALAAAASAPASAQSFLDFASGRALLQWQVGASDEAGDKFGFALASGDFDGDGLDDLVVGAPYEDVGVEADAGAVFVYRGTASGLEGVRFLLESHAGGAEEAGDLLGVSLATGDLNGDAFDDLVAGAPGEDTSAGTVLVWYGSAGGLLTSGQFFLSGDLGCGAPSSGSLLGLSLAIGDLNGDGFGDLAAGAPGVALATGLVCVVPGSASGLDAANGAIWLENSKGLESDPPEPGDQFGYALGIGDLFATNQYQDMAVGAPGEAIAPGPASGLALLYTGQAATSAGDFFGSTARLLDTDTPAASDGFGRALALGHVDGHNVDWVAVGAPGYGGDAGRVFAYRPVGGLGIGSFWLDQSNHVIGAATESGDLFGFAVAIADLDGDRVGDFIVGAPGEAPGDDPAHSGLVAVIRGQVAGTLPGEYHTQQSFPIAGAANEAGDEYGHALATGDFNGDGRAELAVGAPGDAISGVAGGAVYIVPEPAAGTLAGAAIGALVPFAGHRIRRRREQVEADAR